MVRVCAALGPWQLIMLVSALRMELAADSENEKRLDYLVLYGNRLSSQMKTTMGTLASGLWGWKSVVWVDDLLQIEGIKSQASLVARCRSILQRIASDEVSELWMGKLAEAPEKLLAEIYPRADIVLYEDGIHSYVVPTPYEHIGWQRIIHPRHTVSALRLSLLEENSQLGRVRGTWLSRSHLERLRRLYLFMARVLPVPRPLSNQADLLLIKSEQLRDVIAQSAVVLRSTSSEESDYSIDNRRQNTPALVIGQCFARWKIMPWDAELSIYQTVVAELIEKGYSVLWKEHPREDQPFFPHLNAWFSPEIFSRLCLPDTWPVEMIADQMTSLTCLAASSSTLIYLNLLYGLPTYTFADRFMDYMWGDFVPISRLILSVVPNIEALEAIHDA